jgi:predicted outer membrane repeat protein
VVVKAAAGETVIMDGSDESMLQNGWADLGGGYYSRPFEGETWLVCFRNRLTGTTARCYPVATLGELMGKYSGKASKTFARYNITGAYHCSGTTLTIYCPAFKPGGDVEMRVSVRDTAIEHWQNHNIVYEGLAFRLYEGKGIYVNDSDDVIIRNCTFQYINTPIGLKRNGNRLLVEGCEFIDDCTRWGFLPKGPDGYSYHGYIETGAVNVYAPYDGRGLVFRNNVINGLFDGLHVSPNNLAPVPGSSETDVYSNTVVRVLDDLIEVDGFARNVRIFRNRMQRYLTGISIAQAVDGPTYVLYNVLGRHGESTAASIDKYAGFPVKTNGGDDYGTTAYAFFYHNTCWTPVANTPGFKVLHAQWRKLVMANNIWYGTYGGWNVYRAVPLSPVTMSHDIVWQEGGPFYHQDYGAIRDYWTQAAVATSGLADIQFLTNAIVAAPDYLGPAFGDFGLSAGSPAIDAGVVVPGVDDESYRGAAPDAGAIEYAVPVDLTVSTLPAGLFISVSGVTNTAPQVRACSPGSVYTISAPGPQPGGAGTQYVFSAWSDGGAQAHDITINSSTNYTATFQTQYLWTAVMNPAAGAGTVTPADGWVAHGAGFTATASPLPGWTFVNWTRAGSGEILGIATNLGVAMTGVWSVVANFQAVGKAYTIQSEPQAGLTMVVDGVTITNTYSFSWASNTVHTIAVEDSAQPVGAIGMRFLWQGWSDGGSHSHAVTARVDSVITADFKTQYQWIPSVNLAPGGSVTPATGWHDSNEVFTATALANPGYVFAGWSGDYTGDDAGIEVTMEKEKRAIASFMAVRFVDSRASGSEDGATWATAYRTLTNALAQAAGGQQIWVASGTYKPAAGTNRTASFNLKSNVELYGGFAGTESLLAQRRWTNNLTVLSGDIDNDAQVTTTNTLQVVRASQVTNAVLDGFTVVQGCNNTGFGGGMGIIGGSNVVVRRCVFDNNTATRGGAIYIQSDSFISKCMFRNNTAEQRGGAAYTRSSSPRFENSVFFRNSITTTTVDDSCGGAIALYDQAVSMVNCSFYQNNAPMGRALYLSNAAEGYARNCIFRDGGDHGGGIWVKSALANPGDKNFATLMSVIFSDVNGTFNPPEKGTGANNIDADPLFVAPSSGDLHLQAGSPCIGMATTGDTPTDDLDGNPRNGTADLGAYEYVSPIQSRNVMVSTAPAGLLVVVDGVTNPAPQSVIWTNSDPHVISTPALQAGSAGVRYAFAAWSDGGAQTHSVTNPAVTNYLAQFITQHLFTASATGGGTVNITSGWYDSGSSATVTANAGAYYQFTSWSGDVPGGAAAANPLSVAMDQPKTVLAGFAASLTQNTQTPQWWLAQYGWSNNFENAATNDTDKDTVPAWQEYLADTIPTNGDSYLRITGMRPGAGRVDVQWLGGTSVVQYLEQGGSVTGAVWLRVATNLPPTAVAVTNGVMVDPAATQLFYRVRTVR